MAKNESYNGYKNYQTWNVALWINNTESLYRVLVAYAKRCTKIGLRPTYTGFMRLVGLYGVQTGDGVAYSNSRVCRSELSELLFDDLMVD